MREYIDREKIMLKTCSDCTRQVNLVCKHPEPCGKLISAFLCEEQEDVAPVIHAKFLYEPGGVVCSECGKKPMIQGDEDGYFLFNPKYCPHCGSKMDLE